MNTQYVSFQPTSKCIGYAASGLVGERGSHGDL